MIHTTGRLRRFGLTLMELMVVLIILIAVAGIIVVSFPSMLTRANVASCSTNISETARAFVAYEAHHGVYPDHYDSLTDDSGAIIDNMLNNAGGGVFNGIATTTLTAAQAGALHEAGIANMHVHAPTGTAEPYHLTFNPYKNAVTAPTPIATGSKVVVLDNAWASELGLPATNHTYAVFGIGKRCTIIGRMIMEPPVHFADVPDENPDQKYGRFAAVYSIGTATNPLHKAKFVRILTFHPEGPVGTGEHISEYWKIQSDNK